MSAWFVVLSLAAALDPIRSTMACRAPAPGRRRVVAAGTAVTALVLIAVAAFGDAILSGLDITEESWRIAAGIVVGLAGVRTMMWPPPSPLPLDGYRRAIVPFAFPLLIKPEVAVLAVLYGATESMALTAAAILAAAALVGAAAAVPIGGGPVSVASSRLLGAALIVAAVALIVAGIRDV